MEKWLSPMAFIKEKFQKKKKKFFFLKLLMNEQGLKCLSYFGRNHGKIYQKKKKKLKFNDDYHW